MKPALRLLITLATILCCTTIASAAVQDTHTGVVFEKACVLEGEIGFWANFNAPKRTVDSPVDLTDFRKDHILNRHGSGRGKSGKTEFPSDWSDEKVLHEISDVATDPTSTVTPGRWGADRITGTRDGVDITVDLYPSNSKHAGKISTGYPTNTPVNP